MGFGKTTFAAFPFHCGHVTVCNRDLTSKAVRCEVFVTQTSRRGFSRETGHPYRCPMHTATHTTTTQTIETDADSLEPAWATVCTFDQLEPLWGEAALLESVQLAIFLLPDGSLYAVTNRDPATGAFVMSRGIVGSRGDRHTVASPLHKEVYDLETGECFGSPELSLRTFPVRVEDGVVQVQLTEHSP